MTRIGTVVSLPDVALAELAAASFDLVWIDLEHGALDVRDAQALAIAVRAAGGEAHVRLPSWDTDRLPAVIDAGVDGIVAPRVESSADAAALVRRLRYPPDGDRGYGPRRAGTDGHSQTPRRTLCTIQIESLAGVERAPEIAAVAGLDAIVVGCADLSWALGVQGDPFGETMRAAVVEVAKAAGSAGVLFGVAGGAGADGLTHLAGGRAELIVYSVDIRLYAAAMDAAAAQVTTALEAVRGAA